MSIETANLIVACASFVVMVVTLVIACVTLRFMVKNSKGYLRENHVRKKGGIMPWIIYAKQVLSLRRLG
ncbi:MAG: hypothetical protein IJ524_02800 [Bacteroidales bacterium]|nr:hypothetical protein [Bacteroidales bacterium]